MTYQRHTDGFENQDKFFISRPFAVFDSERRRLVLQLSVLIDDCGDPLRKITCIFRQQSGGLCNWSSVYPKRQTVELSTGIDQIVFEFDPGQRESESGRK